MHVSDWLANRRYRSAAQTSNSAGGRFGSLIPSPAPSSSSGSWRSQQNQQQSRSGRNRPSSNFNHIYGQTTYPLQSNGSGSMDTGKEDGGMIHYHHHHHHHANNSTTSCDHHHPLASLTDDSSSSYRTENKNQFNLSTRSMGTGNVSTHPILNRTSSTPVDEGTAYRRSPSNNYHHHNSRNYYYSRSSSLFTRDNEPRAAQSTKTTDGLVKEEIFDVEIIDHFPTLVELYAERPKIYRQGDCEVTEEVVFVEDDPIVTEDIVCELVYVDGVCKHSRTLRRSRSEKRMFKKMRKRSVKRVASAVPQQRSPTTLINAEPATNFETTYDQSTYSSSYCGTPVSPSFRRLGARTSSSSYYSPPPLSHSQAGTLATATSPVTSNASTIYDSSQYYDYGRSPSDFESRDSQQRKKISVETVVQRSRDNSYNEKMYSPPPSHKTTSPIRDSARLSSTRRYDYDEHLFQSPSSPPPPTTASIFSTSKSTPASSHTPPLYSEGEAQVFDRFLQSSLYTGAETSSPSSFLSQTTVPLDMRKSYSECGQYVDENRSSAEHADIFDDRLAGNVFSCVSDEAVKDTPQIPASSVSIHAISSRNDEEEDNKPTFHCSNGTVETRKMIAVEYENAKESLEVSDLSGADDESTNVEKKQRCSFKSEVNFQTGNSTTDSLSADRTNSDVRHSLESSVRTSDATDREFDGGKVLNGLDSIINWHIDVRTIQSVLNVSAYLDDAANQTLNFSLPLATPINDLYRKSMISEEEDRLMGVGGVDIECLSSVLTVDDVRIDSSDHGVAFERDEEFESYHDYEKKNKEEEEGDEDMSSSQHFTLPNRDTIEISHVQEFAIEEDPCASNMIGRDQQDMAPKSLTGIIDWHFECQQVPSTIKMTTVQLAKEYPIEDSINEKKETATLVTIIKDIVNASESCEKSSAKTLSEIMDWHTAQGSHIPTVCMQKEFEKSDVQEMLDQPHGNAYFNEHSFSDGGNRYSLDDIINYHISSGVEAHRTMNERPDSEIALKDAGDHVREGSKKLLDPTNVVRVIRDIMSLSASSEHRVQNNAPLSQCTSNDKQENGDEEKVIGSSSEIQSADHEEERKSEQQDTLRKIIQDHFEAGTASEHEKNDKLCAAEGIRVIEQMKKPHKKHHKKKGKKMQSTFDQASAPALESAGSVESVCQPTSSSFEPMSAKISSEIEELKEAVPLSSTSFFIDSNQLEARSDTSAPVSTYSVERAPETTSTTIVEDECKFSKICQMSETSQEPLESEPDDKQELKLTREQQQQSSCSTTVTTTALPTAATLFVDEMDDARMSIDKSENFDILVEGGDDHVLQEMDVPFEKDEMLSADLIIYDTPVQLITTASDISHERTDLTSSSSSSPIKLASSSADEENKQFVDRTHTDNTLAEVKSIESTNGLAQSEKSSIEQQAPAIFKTLLGKEEEEEVFVDKKKAEDELIENIVWPKQPSLHSPSTSPKQLEAGMSEQDSTETQIDPLWKQETCAEILGMDVFAASMEQNVTDKADAAETLEMKEGEERPCAGEFPSLDRAWEEQQESQRSVMDLSCPIDHTSGKPNGYERHEVPTAPEVFEHKMVDDENKKLMEKEGDVAESVVKDDFVEIMVMEAEKEMVEEEDSMKCKKSEEFSAVVLRRDDVSWASPDDSAAIGKDLRRGESPVIVDEDNEITNVERLSDREEKRSIPISELNGATTIHVESVEEEYIAPDTAATVSLSMVDKEEPKELTLITTGASESDLGMDNVEGLCDENDVSQPLSSPGSEDAVQMDSSGVGLCSIISEAMEATKVTHVSAHHSTTASNHSCYSLDDLCSFYIDRIIEKSSRRYEEEDESLDAAHKTLHENSQYNEKYYEMLEQRRNIEGIFGEEPVAKKASSTIDDHNDNIDWKPLRDTEGFLRSEPLSGTRLPHCDKHFEFKRMSSVSACLAEENMLREQKSSNSIEPLYSSSTDRYSMVFGTAPRDLQELQERLNDIKKMTEDVDDREEFTSTGHATDDDVKNHVKMRSEVEMDSSALNDENIYSLAFTSSSSYDLTARCSSISHDLGIDERSSSASASASPSKLMQYFSKVESDDEEFMATIDDQRRLNYSSISSYDLNARSSFVAFNDGDGDDTSNVSMCVDDDLIEAAVNASLFQADSASSIKRKYDSLMGRLETLKSVAHSTAQEDNDNNTRLQTVAKETVDLLAKADTAYEELLSKMDLLKTKFDERGSKQSENQDVHELAAAAPVTKKIDISPMEHSDLYVHESYEQLIGARNAQLGDSEALSEEKTESSETPIKTPMEKRDVQKVAAIESISDLSANDTSFFVSSSTSKKEPLSVTAPSTKVLNIDSSTYTPIIFSGSFIPGQYAEYMGARKKFYGAACSEQAQNRSVPTKMNEIGFEKDNVLKSNGFKEEKMNSEKIEETQREEEKLEEFVTFEEVQKLSMDIQELKSEKECVELETDTKTMSSETEGLRPMEESIETEDDAKISPEVDEVKPKIEELEGSFVESKEDVKISPSEVEELKQLEKQGPIKCQEGAQISRDIEEFVEKLQESVEPKEESAKMSAERKELKSHQEFTEPNKDGRISQNKEMAQAEEAKSEDFVEPKEDATMLPKTEVQEPIELLADKTSSSEIEGFKQELEEPVEKMAREIEGFVETLQESVEIKDDAKSSPYADEVESEKEKLRACIEDEQDVKISSSEVEELEPMGEKLHEFVELKEDAKISPEIKVVEPKDDGLEESVECKEGAKISREIEGFVEKLQEYVGLVDDAKISTDVGESKPLCQSVDLKKDETISQKTEIVKSNGEKSKEPVELMEDATISPDVRESTLHQESFDFKKDDAVSQKSEGVKHGEKKKARSAKMKKNGKASQKTEFAKRDEEKCKQDVAVSPKMGENSGEHVELKDDAKISQKMKAVIKPEEEERSEESVESEKVATLSSQVVEQAKFKTNKVEEPLKLKKQGKSGHKKKGVKASQEKLEDSIIKVKDDVKISQEMEIAKPDDEKEVGVKMKPEDVMIECKKKDEKKLQQVEVKFEMEKKEEDGNDVTTTTNSQNGDKKANKSSKSKKSRKKAKKNEGIKVEIGSVEASAGKLVEDEKSATGSSKLRLSSGLKSDDVLLARTGECDNKTEQLKSSSMESILFSQAIVNMAKETFGSPALSAKEKARVCVSVGSLVQSGIEEKLDEDEKLVMCLEERSEVLAQKMSKQLSVSQNSLSKGPSGHGKSLDTFGDDDQGKVVVGAVSFERTRLEESESGEGACAAQALLANRSNERMGEALAVDVAASCEPADGSVLMTVDGEAGVSSKVAGKKIPTAAAAAAPSMTTTTMSLPKKLPKSAATFASATARKEENSKPKSSSSSSPIVRRPDLEEVEKKMRRLLPSYVQLSTTGAHKRRVVESDSVRVATAAAAASEPCSLPSSSNILDRIVLMAAGEEGAVDDDKKKKKNVGNRKD